MHHQVPIIYACLARTEKDTKVVNGGCVLILK